MGRIKGMLTMPTNLEVQISAPLDDRQLVEYYSDLIDEDVWKASDDQIYVYAGMLVIVGNDPNKDLNGLYRLLDEDFKDYKNWEKIGGVNQEVFNALTKDVSSLQQELNSMVKITKIGDNLILSPEGELSAHGSSSEIIDDSNVVKDKTWSSSKINEELNDRFTWEEI